MTILVDSGSSKAHWRLISSNGETVEFETEGLNPFHCATSMYRDIIAEIFPKDIDSEDVKRVFFYGAGCASEKMAEQVRLALSDYFRSARIYVYSDLLGAARALFGNGSGLVVILGTGVSVGYYDGYNVERKTPSLGYILGDEGSGAYLGKKLIRMWLYGDLSTELSKKLNLFCPLDITTILKKVYKEASAGRFLASFVPFIVNNLNHPEISQLVDLSFNKFVSRHLQKYSCFPAESLGIVGSVGYFFRDSLEKAIEENGGRVSSIIQYPIDNLQAYHLNNDISPD
jgi:N-acetylglucosamine kinase-like BadF-type ATPase